MSESDNPANVQPGGATPASIAEANRRLRRGWFKNFFLVVEHLQKASASENVKQRFSDYLTIILVVICVLSLVIAVSLPAPAPYKLLPLLLTVIAVLLYVVNRLGIITSLTSRQAIIVWQVLVAGFWLGVTSAMLVMLGCIYFINRTGMGF